MGDTRKIAGRGGPLEPILYPPSVAPDWRPRNGHHHQHRGLPPHGEDDTGFRCWWKHTADIGVAPNRGSVIVQRT
eukprot:2658946-Pyramimonas_sp.AAC.1